MKKIQKPHDSNKIKNKNTKSRFQIVSSAHNYYKVVMNEFEKIEIKEYGKNTKKRTNEAASTEYWMLPKILKKIEINGERKKVVAIDVQMVPYKIPAMYSLEYEEDAVILMKKRMDIISKSICRTDLESIALDWKRLGEDLHGAICKCRRSCVEKNG